MSAFGGALRRGGEAERADSVLLEAAELARALGDSTLLAQVALAWTGQRGVGIVQPEFTALLAEAAAGLGNTDNALRARVLARLVLFHSFVDPERAVALANEAVIAGRRSGDPAALATALYASTFGLNRPDQVEDLQRVRAEIAQLAEEGGELDVALPNQSSMIFRAAVSCKRDELDEALANYVRMTTESRSPYSLALATIARGMVAAMEGRYVDAEELAEEVRSCGRRLREPLLAGNSLSMLFPAWREGGRVADLESSTRKATEVAPGVVAYRAGLAQLLCDIGKLDEAAKHIDALAANGFGGIPDDVTRTFNLCAVAEVAAVLGDRGRAEVLAEMLRPLAGTASVVGPVIAYHGAVDRYLGLLALSLGHVDEAVADLGAALAIHESMGARPWSARTRYDLARALLVRQHAGDRERAVGLLNEALSTANDLGMTKLVEEALATKLELQGVASSSPASSIDALSASVSLERPDLSCDAASDGQITIVFSDIEGYTAMIDRLGDDRTQALLRDHNAIVRRELHRHGGREVKSQGDGFMLAFGSPGDALACAVAIQKQISAHDFCGEQVRLRIGLHVGKVISEGEDFFGRTVVLAARVADRACGGEVLVTPSIRDAVPTMIFDEGRRVILKGFSGPHTVHRVAWQMD